MGFYADIKNRMWLIAGGNCMEVLAVTAVRSSSGTSCCTLQSCTSCISFSQKAVSSHHAQHTEAKVGNAELTKGYRTVPSIEGWYQLTKNVNWSMLNWLIG